jgi:flagellar hook-associated protein 3 FlgL
MVLETTTPHQIWLQDVGSSTVLSDLGLVDQANGNPPHNIATSARVSGGSLFDMVISLRNDLYNGSVVDIGGSALKGLDAGINNLLSARAEIGSINERLKGVGDRIAYEIPQVTQQVSRITDVDMAKAITDLKMLEYTHQAALQTAAKVLQPTLMDYLR